MFLSEGPVKASEAKKQARADGIAERTLARAKKRLSIVTEKKDRCWWWKLPETGDEEGTNNPETSFRF